MITWGNLLAMVRRSVLKDIQLEGEDTADLRWGDDELADFCGWALDEFALHTARKCSTDFTADGLTSSYTLPDNLFSSELFDQNGRVEIEYAGTLSVLDPVAYTERLRPDSLGFYTYPNEILHVTPIPRLGSILHIRYFGYYTHPTDETTQIEIPHWAELAVCYLMGAHALTGVGTKTAIIRQWGQKPDTGKPEDNPLRRQQLWFHQLYEALLAKHEVQDRINHWRGQD